MNKIKNKHLNLLKIGGDSFKTQSSKNIIIKYSITTTKKKTFGSLESGGFLFIFLFILMRITIYINIKQLTEGGLYG